MFVPQTARYQCCSLTCSGKAKTKRHLDTFWGKVEKNGPIPGHVPDLGPCWIWQGYKMPPYGYGTHRVGGKTVLAHRTAFTISGGKIQNGEFLCHKCDNPSCVRPDHMFPGTQKENLADMVSKDRHTRGDRNGLRLHPECVPKGSSRPNSKLTESDVVEIRERFAAGELQREIARDKNIAQGRVSGIVNRRIWKHVP